jgi:hypothetical protein
MGIVLVVKLVALHLIVRGHFWLGARTIITEKVAGTAVSARLYRVARPQIEQVAAFVRLRAWAVRLRRRAHGYLSRFAAWRAAFRAARVASRRPAGLRARPGTHAVS